MFLRCAGVLVFAFSVASVRAQNCTEPTPATQCTPPATFNYSVVANGTVNWSSLLPAVTPNNFTTTVRITGTGKVIIQNSDFLMKSSSAVLYVDGPELVVNNGNFSLETAGARAIFKNSDLRTSGNFINKAQSFFCMTDGTLEVGDENAGGVFNTTGNNHTSANFQNDGGYRYLKNLCFNVTHDLQLSSSGNGTSSGGGLDVFINVCGEIGDAGANHASPASFGSKDGNDSGNFQNNKLMKIFNSKFALANGSVQVASSSTLQFCNTSFKTNVGSFQNSGAVEGSGLCLAIQDLIQNSGAWQNGSVSTWYAGNGISSPPGGLPSSAGAAGALACFASCSCTSGPPPPTPVTVATNQSICTGNPYFFNGQNLTVSGIYRDTLARFNGADSIVVLTLTVVALPNLVANDATICAGQSIQLAALVSDLASTTGSLAFFNSLADAQNGTNALANTLVSPAQTAQFFVKKTTTAAGCADIENFKIKVNQVSAMSHSVCSANSTPGNIADDVFTAFINASNPGAAIGEKYEVLLNGSVLNPGGTVYGTAFSPAQVFPADGSSVFSFVVRDVLSPACTATTSVGPVSPCSIGALPSGCVPNIVIKN